MNYLDIESWSRKNHFQNFLNYSQPFFNITANVEVSTIKEISKSKGFSFFLSYYYVALKVINEIECFRYRIRGDRVIIHDTIHGGCAVLNEDETFSFAYFDFSPNFEEYHEGASNVLDELKRNPALDPQFHRDDLIHASVIPWLSFTSFEHAKRFGTEDSTPKLAFGKCTKQGEHLLMPISISVHHALMDGIHVGKFFERFSELSRIFERI